MSFKLGARAQVCLFCRFVVVRTDRGLEKYGRVADLLELPSPFVVGSGGTWNGQRFEVEGRVQYDRHNAPSAPWQEFLLGFPEKGSTAWVASAQGRWYVTYEISGVEFPSLASLRPGTILQLGAHGVWSVQEVGQRRLVSAEGSLTGIPRPDVITGYADLSGPEGRFGTLDFGDGSEPPVAFLGQQFDPASIVLDSGAPLGQPTAQVKDVQCPTCGGNLPLLSGQVERLICRYCGTQSDLTHGKLAALGPTPRLTSQPQIALGAEGTLRGIHLICCGFVVRSCRVDDERYAWREYLLWGGATVGYVWLMEEDDVWSLVTPIEVGDINQGSDEVAYRGETYAWAQSVKARVDEVVGEFYWKVAIGETVKATEFKRGQNKISREATATEVVFSFCSPVHPRELDAFGAVVASAAADGTPRNPVASKSTPNILLILLVVVALVLFVMFDDCDGGGGGGGFFPGGGFYSK